MKIIVLLSLLTSFAFSNEIYVDVGLFSDDGGVTRHELLKINNFDVKNNESASCSFFTENTIELELNLIKVDGVYLFNMQRHPYNEDGNIEDTFTTATSLDEILMVSSAGDGYVSETIVVGSKRKIHELNRAMLILDGGNGVDFSKQKALDTKVNSNVSIHGNSYKFECEFESGEDF